MAEQQPQLEPSPEDGASPRGLARRSFSEGGWRWERWCLLFILLLGLGLRLYGIDWGYPASLHCDETATLGVALRMEQSFQEHGVLRPDRSNYGALPFYLLLLFHLPLSALLGLLQVPVDPNALGLLIGRVLSALADTGTILLVYLIARRALAPPGRLLAAGLYATTLLAVREAHFFTVDSLQVLSLVFLVWLSVRAAERPDLRSFVWCGVGLGLGLSVKTAILPVAPLPLIIWLWAAAKASREEHSSPWPARIVLLLIAVISLAFLVAWSGQRGVIEQIGQAFLARSRDTLLASGHAMIFWERQMKLALAGMDSIAVKLGALGLLVGLLGFGYSLLPGGRRVSAAAWRRIAWPLVYLALGVAIFVLLNPYSMLEPRRYWLSSERDPVLLTILIVGGTFHSLPFAFTFQFVDSQPFLYQLRHVYPYALGWALMVVSLAAVVYWTIRLLRGRAGKLWVMVVAALLLLLSMGGTWIKMVRYVLPQLPLLCLLAGGMLSLLIGSHHLTKRFLGVTVAALTLIGSLLWCLAYLHIYSRPDCRLVTLELVRQTASPGQHVLLEEDDTWGAAGLALWQRLPDLEVRVYDPHKFEHDYYGLPLPPEVRKAKEVYLAEHLTWADFVVLTGLRRERMAPVAEHFPVQWAWYQRLFDEQADFSLWTACVRRPQLGSWHISDQNSEPTFRLFDHPDVYVFVRKSARQETPEEGSAP